MKSQEKYNKDIENDDRLKISAEFFNNSKDLIKSLVKVGSSRYFYKPGRDVIERGNYSGSTLGSKKKQEIITINRTDLNKMNKNFILPAPVNVSLISPIVSKVKEPKITSPKKPSKKPSKTDILKSELEDAKGKNKAKKEVANIIKKEQSKKNITVKNDVLDDLYDGLNDLLSKKGNKRARGQFEKQFDKEISKDIFNIMDIQKSFDFYPTPKECLTRLIPKNSPTWKISEEYLEPTAGLGSITHYIQQNDKTAKITAVEMIDDLAKKLKKLQPNVNVINKNFLKIPIDQFIKIDTIVCNPPFGSGSDKRFYYDFLFRCIAISNNAIDKGNKGEHSVYFISPELVETSKNIKNGDTIPVDNIYSDKRLTNKKLSQVIKDITGFKIPEKNVKSIMINQDDDKYQEVFEILNIQQLQYLGSCEGFGGTKIKASMYNFIMCC